MRLMLLAATTALLLVGACANVRESRLNPFNWFQRSTATSLEPATGYADPTDNRALVDQVLSLTIEPIPGGAIVRATGLPPTQGWWDAELVAENDGEPVEGVMSYRFAVAAPRTQTRTSTRQSREITAAVYLSDITLSQITRITVRGARNERTSRR